MKELGWVVLEIPAASLALSGLEILERGDQWPCCCPLPSVEAWSLERTFSWLLSEVEGWSLLRSIEKGSS